MYKKINVNVKEWYETEYKSETTYDDFYKYIVNKINEDIEDARFKLKYVTYRAYSGSSYTEYGGIALPSEVFGTKTKIILTNKSVVNAALSGNSCHFYLVACDNADGILIQKFSMTDIQPTGTVTNPSGFLITFNKTEYLDFAFNTDYFEDYNIYLWGISMNDYEVPVGTPNIIATIKNEFNETDVKTVNFFKLTGNSARNFLLSNEDKIIQKQTATARYHFYIQQNVDLFLTEKYRANEYVMDNVLDIITYDSKFSNYTFNISNLNKYPTGIIPQLAEVNGEKYDGIIASSSDYLLIKSLNQ